MNKLQRTPDTGEAGSTDNKPITFLTWVKATERLPEGYGKHYFCIIENKITGSNFKSIAYKAEKNFDVDTKVFSVLEWLEETPSPAKCIVDMLDSDTGLKEKYEGVSDKDFEAETEATNIVLHIVNQWGNAANTGMRGFRKMIIDFAKKYANQEGKGISEEELNVEAGKEFPYIVSTCVYDEDELVDEQRKAYIKGRKKSIQLQEQKIARDAMDEMYNIAIDEGGQPRKLSEVEKLMETYLSNLKK